MAPGDFSGSYFLGARAAPVKMSPNDNHSMMIFICHRCLVLLCASKHSFEI